MPTYHTKPRVFSLGLCLTVLSMAVSAGATTRQGRQPQPSVAQPQDWWWPPPGGGAERGKLEEIKDKRRVYVTFFAFTGKRDGDEIRRNVLRALGSYAGLEVVSRIEQADFALYVSASQMPLLNERRARELPVRSDAPPRRPGEPDWPTTLEMSVLVRGAEQTDGTRRPRIVWESRQEAWDSVGADAGSSVRAFIGRLKKARGEK